VAFITFAACSHNRDYCGMAYAYNFHNKGMRLRRVNVVGQTLSEVMVATLLLGAFFASIFELNAVCLRYINASKENVAAIAAVQDRAETLRNLAFVDLTNVATIQTLLSTPANGSDFAKNATETVTLSAYPAPSGSTKLTRQSDGTVSVNSTASDLGQTLVQLTVSSSWNATFGSRSRSEQTTTIISNGTKK